MQTLDFSQDVLRLGLHLKICQVAELMIFGGRWMILRISSPITLVRCGAISLRRFLLPLSWLHRLIVLGGRLVCVSVDQLLLLRRE